MSKQKQFLSNRTVDCCICLTLLLSSFLAYAQVWGFDFINYDDPEEVSHNVYVRSGMNAKGVTWAVTSGENANWMPVTKLSHLLVGQIFGLQPGWHHLINVLFHALAAVLLFLFLSQATCSRWVSAFVAAIFTLHPLHVESVAWVSERKDVLSAFFWFLTLWLYLRYVGRRTPIRYALVLVSFCLGLLSKPMVITLPCVLLLLDIWPLRRAVREPERESAAQENPWHLLREKIPLFVAAVIMAIITFLVQRRAGTMGAEGGIAVSMRVGNALVSYGVYLLQIFWPHPLAVFYPYPMHLPAGQVIAALLTMALISVLVLLFVRRFPFLAVGWFWYVGTLVPVIGLVQVGGQAHADRYTYLPSVGIVIALAWTAKTLLERWPQTKNIMVAVAVAGCLACAIATAVQLRYWRNSEVLFQHALQVTTNNAIAEANLGAYWVETQKRLPEAVTHLETALHIRPHFAEARTNLGLALLELNRLPEARRELEAAVEEKPDLAAAHNNLGSALAKTPSQLPEAIKEYKTALAIQPAYPEALNNLGFAYLRMPGHLPEAISKCEAALQLDRKLPEAHNNLGLALSQTPDRLGEAIGQYEEALRIKPEFPEAQLNLGSALLKSNQVSQAIPHFKAALHLRPNYGNAHYGLAVALAKTGHLPEAISEYEAALQIGNDPELRRLVQRLRSTSHY